MWALIFDIVASEVPRQGGTRLGGARLAKVLFLFDSPFCYFVRLNTPGVRFDSVVLGVPPFCMIGNSVARFVTLPDTAGYLVEDFVVVRVASFGLRGF